MKRNTINRVFKRRMSYLNAKYKITLFTIPIRNAMNLSWWTHFSWWMSGFESIIYFQFERTDILQASVKTFALVWRKQFLHEWFHAMIEASIHLIQFNSLATFFLDLDLNNSFFVYQSGDERKRDFSFGVWEFYIIRNLHRNSSTVILTLRGGEIRNFKQILLFKNHQISLT